MPDPSPGSELGQLIADIVAAYVAHHTIDAMEVPVLIQSVYKALATVNAAPQLEAPAQQPAVPIRKSIFPDYIVCLEDGKKLKMLKRHLKTSYNMEPDEYRAKWGLPPKYPLVAPNYAQQRSSLAKKIGLGTRRQSTAPDVRQARQLIKRGATV